MADVPLSMANIIYALKYWYLDGLRNQVNDNASPFVAQLERDSEHVEGYKIKMALSYGVSGGIGNRPDIGPLPTVNPRKFAQAEWETQNIFGVFSLSDKTIQASRSNRAAFAQALTHSMESLEKDLKVNLSRQAMGDGTGAMGTISAVSTSGTTHTCTISNIKNFCEGQLIDCYTTTVKDTDTAEITIVDRDNSTITFVSDTAPEANDVVYIAGNKDLELTGVKKVLTADNEIYGINRATTGKYFNPSVVAVNAEISELAIQKGIDDAQDDAGNVIGFLLADKGVVRGYSNLLAAMKSIVNTIELKGGYKAPSFNGIPLVGDKFCASGELLALSLDNWKMYEMADWDWLDEGSGILQRNGTLWGGVMRKYCDLGCDLPRGQVRFTGIQTH